MSFPDESQLEEYLGVTFDVSETARAASLLSMSVALVRGYTGQTLSLVTDDTVTLPGPASRTLFLPEIPVIGVTSVTYAGVELVAEIDYQVWTTAGLLTRDYHYGYGYGWSPGYVEVTYTHGYATIPDDLRAVVLTSAARGWENPTMMPRESVGTYSPSYAQSGFNLGAGVYLTDSERAVLDRYRIFATA